MSTALISYYRNNIVIRQKVSCGSGYVVLTSTLTITFFEAAKLVTDTDPKLTKAS
jgi:hypothetical protein